ncbi:hypothetical protein [Actinomyces glycerinitolerans]|uniref:hypothetical protein n=1 Tax=Actinomyces glycerinitolerans TaxID=1892869 RepID=UPI000A874C03|nr:hypothetical protein [Actinomyces glycerinitolerans]
MREDAAGELQANVAATDALLEVLDRQEPDRFQEVAESQDALQVAALRLELLGRGGGS